MRFRFLLTACALITVCFSAEMARAQSQSFDAWLAEFKVKATEQGISQKTLDQAFLNLQPDPYVIKLDRKQPEDKLSFSTYVQNTVAPRRIREGRMLMQDHRALLHQISQTYQVEPRFIIALWGMETDYGNHKGNFSVVQSLATLAWEGRRAELFGNELMAALTIIDTGLWGSYDLIGSWAGAMGNCQFMPSSYLKFAVDWDQDGKADIWHSTPDTLASIANYLHQSGWQPGIGWGERSGSKDAIYPGTAQEGGFKVTSNYEVLMKWNRSRYFATSVGLLSDQLDQ